MNLPALELIALSSVASGTAAVREPAVEPALSASTPATQALPPSNPTQPRAPAKRSKPAAVDDPLSERN